MNRFAAMHALERRSLMAAFGGWATDAFDYMIFSFVIATLIDIWNINTAQAGLLGSVTLVFAMVGGWLARWLLKRAGPLRLMQISILWFSVCTVWIGFADSVWQVLTLRAVQGLGFGGEWVAAATLIGRTMRLEHRGKALTLVQVGWATGWALAAIMYLVFHAVLPETLAWRALFWFALIPALVSLSLRRGVVVPPASVDEPETKAEHLRDAVPARTGLGACLVAVVACASVQGGYYAVMTWLPAYLRLERHLSVAATGACMLFVIAGSICGFLASASLARRWGRRPVLVVFSVLAAGSVYGYMTSAGALGGTLWLGAVLGFLTSGVLGAMSAFVVARQGVAAKATGRRFLYNISRGVAALFPGLVGYLGQSFTLADALWPVAVVAYALVVLVSIWPCSALYDWQ